MHYLKLNAPPMMWTEDLYFWGIIVAAIVVCFVVAALKEGD